MRRAVKFSLKILIVYRKTRKEECIFDIFTPTQSRWGILGHQIAKM